MSRWLRFAGVVLFALALAGGGVVVQISHVNARLLTHRTPGLPAQTPADYGLPYEDVTLTTADGLRLAAWYVPSRNGAAILAQHGYHSDRTEMLNEAEMLAGHGYGTLLIEARAHGYSEGELITFGLNEVLDIRAGLDYLRSRPEVDGGRIGALGNSQGAVTLLLAAARFAEIRAYAGNSPYASLQDEIATGVKALTGLEPFPFAPLIQFFAEREAGFEAVEVAPIRHVGAIAPRPVFLMQGGADTTVPADSGQRLYDAAGEPRELWFEPDLGHVEFDTKRPAEYERRVAAYFDRYLLGR